MNHSVEHVLKLSPSQRKIIFCTCGATIETDLSSLHLALGSLVTADVNYELARHNADSPWVEVQYMKLYCEDCKGLFSIQSSLKGILTHAGLFIILFPFFVRHSFLLWWCPVVCDLIIFVMWEWQKQIYVFIQLSFCLNLIA